MPNTAILCGVLLIIIGAIGYGVAFSHGNASVTALIPAFFGIAIAGLGAASRAMEGMRKHLMHFAVLIGLLGFIATAAMLLRRIGELSATPAVLAQAAMCVVCLVFVALCVKSFIDVRRNAAS